MITVLVLLLLSITRLLGLTWGYPYLFHPDENNITTSLLQLSCPRLDVFQLADCLNPNFYAYGQIYTYLGRLLTPLVGLVQSEATLSPLIGSLSLRLISAISAVLTGLVIFKLFRREFKSQEIALIGTLLFIFTPIFIQFSHFGTTESVLGLLFVLILYFQRKPYFAGLLIGISSAIKVSSFALLLIPVLESFFSTTKTPLKYRLRQLALTGLISIAVFTVLSPHNWLNVNDYLSSLLYESAVASGKLPVFYTAQFGKAIPFLFPITQIFPYALGLPVFGFGLIGLVFFGVKKNRLWLASFVILFVYQNFLYAKWTRFFLYCFLLWLFFASLAVKRLLELKHLGVTIAVYLAIFTQLLVGTAFFSVYLQPDPRVEAGKFLNRQVNSDTLILAESANVIDLPLVSQKADYRSHFLYDLETSIELKDRVFEELKVADYIVVDSRRVFRNYTCYKFEDYQLKYISDCPIDEKYPTIREYYRRIFDQQYFKLIKTFSNYPQIGPWQLTDENAEETISVFDHPVVRIYQRVSR